MKVGCSPGCLSSWRQPSEGHTIQEIFSDLQDINLAVWNGPNGYQTENPLVYDCCVHRVQIVSASCLCVFRWINLVRCLGPFFTTCVSLRSGNLMISNAELQFSWFPCVYKQMLRWFPRFQVATTCFSCSPPDLNLIVTNFIFCIHVK